VRSVVFVEFPRIRRRRRKRRRRTNVGVVDLGTYEKPVLEETVGHLIQVTDSGQCRVNRILRVRGIPETEFRLRRSSQTVWKDQLVLGSSLVRNTTKHTWMRPIVLSIHSFI
jgi:hypothetical protein